MRRKYTGVLRVKQGRAADARVGREIFGMFVAKEKSDNVKYRVKYRLHYKDGDPVGHPSNGFFGWGWCHTEKSAQGAVPAFTCNIEHAWEVWVKMAEDFFVFTTFVQLLARAVKVVDRSGGVSYVHLMHRITPLAICRAALTCKKREKDVVRDL